LAPVALVAVVGATGLVAVTAEADLTLPPRTAQELLVDVQGAQLDGLSGTVVQRSNLGIPEIPGAGHSGSDLNSLVSGSHTMKVWFSGPDKVRLQLLGRLGESDVILNGKDLWTWASDDNAATHRTFGAAERSEPAGQLPADAPKTPQEAADRLLDAVEPTTEVSTDRNVRVASRDAYALVLRPKDKVSLLTEVRIAVDGETLVPLQVEAFAGSESVFNVAYTKVDFDQPDDAQFAFNPPPGAKVTQTPAPSAKDKAAVRSRAEDASAGEPTVVGSGWGTVVVSKVPAGDSGGQLGQFLNTLPKVSESWGSGRLLAGPAFSAVFTDDGRVAIGSVTPERVYEALAK
jgi:outer membrane lipoprotein-sorting protein